MPTSSINFTPQNFLRCHSKQKNDSADIQTQVWLCAFAPSLSEPGTTTDIVTTCGGNSVCFINVKTGKVEKKFYSSDNREIFLCLTWVVIKNGSTFLVAGGSTKTLYFIDSTEGFCFHEEKIAKLIGSLKPNIGITSLLSHPNNPNIMFCSASNGKILVLDIGSPTPPDFIVNVQVLHSWKVECEVLTLVFCADREILMGTSDEGIYCFQANSADLTDEETKSKLKQVLVQFPGHPLFLTESPSLVDSVELLENGLIASKCALRGAIYLWDINQWVTMSEDSKSIVRVSPLYELKWSDTDNYFMYMGYDKGSKLLACGDDKGAIWTYDLNWLMNKYEGKNAGSDNDNKIIQPTVVFQWPELVDQYINKKRKLAGSYDIVVNKIALSHCSEYLVAVTSNNMVCIWRKDDE